MHTCALKNEKISPLRRQGENYTAENVRETGGRREGGSPASDIV